MWTSVEGWLFLRNPGPEDCTGTSTTGVSLPLLGQSELAHWTMLIPGVTNGDRRK